MAASFIASRVKTAIRPALIVTPDPERLVRGYYHSAATLDFARWVKERATAMNKLTADDISDLAKDVGFELASAPKAATLSASSPVFTAHEALALGYEESMTRPSGPVSHYNAGGHFCWIGDRTRQIDGAHVEYMRGIDNPIGVKAGPSLAANPSDLIDLIKALCSGDLDQLQPGKISVIVRLGAANVAEMMPGLVSAAVNAGIAGKLVWVCDPCHGNTQKDKASGIKFRAYEDVVAEMKGAKATLESFGLALGGVHIELCGEPVTECTGGPEGTTVADLPKRFGSLCDPRLSYAQSIAAAFEAAMLAARACSRSGCARRTIANSST